MAAAGGGVADSKRINGGATEATGAKPKMGVLWRLYNPPPDVERTGTPCDEDNGWPLQPWH